VSLFSDKFQWYPQKSLTEIYRNVLSSLFVDYFFELHGSVVAESVVLRVQLFHLEGGDKFLLRNFSHPPHLIADVAIPVQFFGGGNIEQESESNRNAHHSRNAKHEDEFGGCSQAAALPEFHFSCVNHIVDFFHATNLFSKACYYGRKSVIAYRCKVSARNYSILFRAVEVKNGCGRVNGFRA